MSDVRWHFREMARGEINQDPMERELFSEEPINDRLIREAIQNSLDAAIRRVDPSAEGPVRVRFSLRGVRSPLDGVSAAAYLEGLSEHLEEGLDAHDSFRRRVQSRGLGDEGMQYLVVEDAGTIGLEGDWRQYDDSAKERADDNHFYWFFRNVGRSGKRDEDGGSWGLGKWVFPDASHASAYIAVTRRRSDDETLLMGQSVLTKHNLDGQKYSPYGYFAEIDGTGAQELALPLRMSEPAHGQFIQQCIADFGLQFRDEPGLSIIVPFPRMDSDLPISRPHLAAAVIHNYFYPIIAKRLEVIIDDGDDSGPVEVNAETIDDVLAHMDLADSGEQSEGSYQRLFAMCREAAFDPAYRHIELSAPPSNKSDHTERGQLVGLRARYDSGELLAFRIHTAVERKETARKEQTSFRLYVQHDDSLTRGHDYYVRGPNSIPKIDILGSRPARTLLVVDEDEPLAAMLRDSEPPAHTSWRPQDERVGKRWVSARNRIEEVRRAPLALLSIWETAPVDLQKDALADIFPADGGARPRRDRKGGPIEKPDRIEPVVPQGHSDFDLHQVSDGFAVRFAPGVEAPPKRVRLRAAYEMPRGNPIASYSPHDFRLHGSGALSVDAKGCQVRSGETGNELLLEVDDPALFSVTVHGFDVHRDVHVRVERAADAQPSEGADNG